jgi:hypothetical protein
LRILFVAFQDSVHTARWLSQLEGQGWDIHLFPSTLQGGPHPLMRSVGIKRHYPAILRLPLRALRRASDIQGNRTLKRWFSKDPHPLTAYWLSRVIRQVRPDIVHSLEFQHAGYLMLEAHGRLRGKLPPWIAGNWGSDIYLFGKLPSHAARIRAILESCDYYTCECERDVRLALDMGLKGTPLPVLPNAGGFDLELAGRLRAPGPTSERRTIVLKGYQHWAGRALAGLNAIELCAVELAGYRVVIPLASPEVQLAAELVAQRTGLSIEVLPRCPYEEMLRLYGGARIYLGLSISDAISQSMLEAIVMGAFPIQSSTACADEWVADGLNGMIVPPEDPQAVAVALRKALTDDALVDQAAEYNARLARDRLDIKVIQPKAVALYDRVYRETHSAAG